MPSRTPAYAHQQGAHAARAARGKRGLWKAFDPKVRNQIRKAEKQGLSVHWGSTELLGEFYAVFARNMCDLGTPVFGTSLFLAPFSSSPVRRALRSASGLGAGRRRPASAWRRRQRDSQPSSLRRFNSTNANMLLYWNLLMRAIARSQQVFDFGRSSVDSNTFRFKKRWGGRPEPAAWQYYLRRGTVQDMRPDNAKYRLFISLWRRFPVRLTRVIGPPIIRGIP